MESKGRKFNFKIGGIVAIAIVAAVVGTLAFTNIDSSSNSDSQTQSVGIGAFVTVEVFNEDGILSHTWEGHNALVHEGRNALAHCISGVDVDERCAFGIDELQIDVLTPGPPLAPDHPNLVFGLPITLTPDGCTSRCTGWESVVTHDYADTQLPNPCEDLGCPELVTLRSFWDPESHSRLNFNVIQVDPPVPFEPNDRMVITMAFEIPE